MTRPIRFALSFAAMLLVASIFASAGWSWPGANGSIVFEAYVPGNGEEAGRGAGIQVAPMGADRSQIKRLTDDPGDRDPQVSPDGGLIVFVRGSNPEAEAAGKKLPSTLYLIGADGSDLRPLTDGLHIDGEPAFSASGNRVYFTRWVRGQGTDVFSVPLDGGGPRRITTGGASDLHPRAASRGGLLTFERKMSGRTLRYQHIFLSRADGSGLRDLTPKLGPTLAATDPEFSPDGRRVAYTTDDRILSVAVNRTRPRLLIPPRRGSDRRYADPNFAPDGRSLLFVAIDDETGRSNLRRLDLRSLRRLPNLLIEPHIGVRGPAWLTRPAP